MIIKFYNIPGISPDNEPHFDSVTIRNLTLNNYIVKYLSIYYYPVQYENRIKLEVTEVPLTLVYNYIAIEMYGKDWFYFVDSFRYVNEKIYYVNLAMDAIQTFYFDISFIKYEGKRSLTFAGLRDNLSIDSTVYVSSITDYDDGNPGIFVFQFKDISGSSVVLEDPSTVSPQTRPQVENIDVTTFVKGTSIQYTDGLKTFFLLSPRSFTTTYVNYYHDGSSTLQGYSFTRSDWISFYNKLVNDPNVVNAYFTTILPKGVTLDGGSGYKLDTNITLYKYGIIKSGNYSDLTNNIIQIQDIKYGSFTTPIRAVCDSNYTQFTIGEVNDNVIVPIELIEPETTYDLYVTMDYSSGVRNYYVNAQPLLDIKFKHVCNSIESVQVFNDMYNMYLSQNKGSLTTGMALQKTQSWVNFGNQILNQNAAKAFSGAMQGGVAGGIVAGVESTITSGVDLFNSLYGIDKSVQAQKENAYYSPDTIKLGNNSTNDRINGFLHRVVIETRVADYQDIIELRKYIGYLSHDIATSKTLLTLLADYNWVNGKKLLMGTATLNLASFNTRDNLVAIKDRLEKGVRFYTNIDNLGK